MSRIMVAFANRPEFEKRTKAMHICQSVGAPEVIPNLGQIASTQRIASLDVMRGTALAGVLIVNLLTSFRVPLAAHMIGHREPLAWGGETTLALVRTLIEFKAITLFSFLFGVGVAIQAERVCEQERRWFLVRRFALLFAFGVLHTLFLWNGDILALYASCGLALIPFLNAPGSALIILGLVFILWPNIAPMPVDFPSAATLKMFAAGAFHAYGNSPWRNLFTFRLRETRMLIVPLWILTWPRTFGLMLWGVAVWREGWLANSPWLWRWGAALGLILTMGGARLRINEAVNIGLSAVYAATLLLLNPRAPKFAAVGRMALTNYLLQSAIFSCIFYSYGLGLIGRVGVLPALSIGLPFYYAQLVASEWWLKRFWFGPFEWFWRSASYLRRQPFLREEGSLFCRITPKL